MRFRTEWRSVAGRMTLALIAARAFAAADFDHDIRPVLEKRCFSCHSAQTKNSGLALETIEGLLQGGKINGPAVIPGNSLDSPLIRYLRGEKRPAMPIGGEPLAMDQVNSLAKWIDGLQPVQSTSKRRYPWPFIKLEQPPVPSVKANAGMRNAINPIDAFVLAKMEQQGLAPAPPVSKRILLRRLYFDLIGLPPTPADMDRFLSDPRSDAYEREIDRLLEDTRYGERWGRHWLDVVRYADSGGGGLDFPLPHMWRFRDYVIRAFNEDRPYDRIIREQIAGDAYPSFGAEGRVAAGFLRLGVFLEGTKEEMRRDLLNDVVGTTGSVFLGMTVGCARCHDHKFDPIPTRDYYRLEAFFAPVTVRAEPVPFTQNERPAQWEQKDKQWQEVLAKRKEEQERIKAQYLERVKSAMGMTLSSPQDLKDLSRGINEGDLNGALTKGVLFTKQEREVYTRLSRRTDGHGNEAGLFKPMAFTAAELIGAGNSAEPNYPVAPATYVLTGGNPKLKGEEVQPGFLSAVTGNDDRLDLEGVVESRRKTLAEWIASPENPLTARVMVNRIWQHHFGEGLVKTPSDFGKNGSGTVHAELIDWLAAHFIESGWSVKSMHRLMLKSDLYRQSMKNPRAADFAKIDADNRYLWRMNRLRLESEVIRDSMLAVSGQLNPAAGGPGFFPEVDDELLKRASQFWEPSTREEQSRRTIYMLQKRAVSPPMLNVFDGTNMNESCSVRGITTVTPQVFALFNSKFANEQSKAMAERVKREAGTDPAKQIERAYSLVLQRAPTETEKAKNLEFLTKGSLADVCLVLLNLNEFMFLE